MHLLIAAAILVAFISNNVPLADIPEKQINIQPSKSVALRLRSDVTPREAFVFKNITSQEHDYSCGSAALATLLNYGLGEKLSEKQVIRGMLKHGDKEQIKRLRAFSLLDMKRLCTVLGYEAAGYKAGIEDVQNSEYWPCIVPIQLYDYRHFVVLKGVHDGHVFLADPFRGNISYSIPQFKKAWFENVIFLVTSDKFKVSGKNMLKLTRDDLCYITEDTARDMIKKRSKPYTFPVYFERDDIQGERQYYRR